MQLTIQLYTLKYIPILFKDVAPQGRLGIAGGFQCTLDIFIHDNTIRIGSPHTHIVAINILLTIAVGSATHIVYRLNINMIYRRCVSNKSCKNSGRAYSTHGK